jgi:hypothetical protein
MFSLRISSSSTLAAAAADSLTRSAPISKYCTNGLRCLRRILAASTRAISGVTVPLVQISMVRRS